MVDEDVQRSAEELRETAAKLRQLARQTRFASTRRELLNLAERFEAWPLNSMAGILRRTRRSRLRAPRPR